MWIEEDIWKEYKIKVKEQEQTEERIRKLTLDLGDCLERERIKMKIVWKDSSKRVVLKSVVVGHFVMWAVRQSPYPFPEDLVKGIEEFSKSLGVFEDATLMETTYRELQKSIGDSILESVIISSWNVAKKGTGNVFVSAYSKPKPDYDFIDLDALARNIARSVWLEVSYDDGTK